MWLDSLSSHSAAAGLCAIKKRVTVLRTPPLFHLFTYYREYSAYGVPNFTILYESFLVKNSVSTFGPLWTITSPQALYYFKMLYCTLSVPSSGLPSPLANASPTYLVPVWVYTPGQWGHQVSLSVTASCGDMWRTETTDRNYGLEKNLRNESGSSLTAKGAIRKSSQRQ